MMISISMLTFTIGSIILWFIIYLFIIKNKFNKIQYYLINILTLSMIIPNNIYYNGKHFDWLIIYNADEKMVYITLIMFLAYTYIFAWVLPQRKNY